MRCRGFDILERNALLDDRAVLESRLHVCRLIVVDRRATAGGVLPDVVEQQAGSARKVDRLLASEFSCASTIFEAVTTILGAREALGAASARRRRAAVELNLRGSRVSGPSSQEVAADGDLDAHGSTEGDLRGQTAHTRRRRRTGNADGTKNAIIRKFTGWERSRANVNVFWGISISECWRERVDDGANSQWIVAATNTRRASGSAPTATWARDTIATSTQTRSYRQQENRISTFSGVLCRSCHCLGKAARTRKLTVIVGKRDRCGIIRGSDYQGQLISVRSGSSRGGTQQVCAVSGSWYVRSNVSNEATKCARNRARIGRRNNHNLGASGDRVTVGHCTDCRTRASTTAACGAIST